MNENQVPEQEEQGVPLSRTLFDMLDGVYEKGGAS